jgi:hypothetical protein
MILIVAHFLDFVFSQKFSGDLTGTVDAVRICSPYVTSIICEEMGNHKRGQPKAK